MHLSIMFRMGTKNVAQALVRADERYARANAEEGLFEIGGKPHGAAPRRGAAP